MTEKDLREFLRRIETEVVQAPDDLKDGSGTIYRRLAEFKEKHGEGWRLQRTPVILEDGSLLTILIRIDPDYLEKS